MQQVLQAGEYFATFFGKLHYSFQWQVVSVQLSLFRSSNVKNYASKVTAVS
jgi:hypothetical protein